MLDFLYFGKIVYLIKVVFLCFNKWYGFFIFLLMYFFLEKFVIMDGDFGGWVRKKSCDVNEGVGYIYCIFGWNKVSILCCCVYCIKLYVYLW